MDEDRCQNQNDKHDSVDHETCPAKGEPRYKEGGAACGENVDGSEAIDAMSMQTLPGLAEYI